MSYAVIRNQKYKRGNLKGIFRHNERKNTNYSNKNIDNERIPLNFHTKQPTFSYEKEFEQIKSKYNLKGQIKEVTGYNNITNTAILQTTPIKEQDIKGLEYEKNSLLDLIHSLEKKLSSLISWIAKKLSVSETTVTQEFEKDNTKSQKKVDSQLVKK